MEMKDRWIRCWKAAGATGDPVPPWEALAARYAEPHRGYHTLRHIEHCLVEFDPVRGQALDPVAVELAVWYHDAVYDTRQRDNEERSARLVESVQGLPAASARRAGDLIRVSTHKKPAADRDGKLFTDIDLAILGQPGDVFQDYERRVREEYAWVPEADFRAGRARILETFLDRFSIYATPYFQERYEKRARLNLTASLLVLKGGST
ncbi:MAG TPA: N-methyl-D-aspartate receptor NMDAR2C subunit [Planctomycetota bacterium]|nr:N-methyl-D-aspartate receptor NMDAR2C subunit [Planctomycetota bacterium]